MPLYSALMSAVQILEKVKIEIGKEDGSLICSPAWRLIHHAQQYVMNQADASMRGSE